MDITGEKHSQTIDIADDRWDRVYPYSFAIFDADTNTESPGDESAPTRVQLAIPPSAISVSVMFANSVSATNSGILEEHNGVVFRNISISGTTGILPARERRALSGGFSDVLKQAKTFLPSTSSALQSLTRSVARTGFFNIDESKDSDSAQIETGYKQFWVLHNLFVHYATRKKNGESSLRLVFEVPKDNARYLVTPIAFDLRKDASQPLLYRYSIQLKSWGLLQSTAATEARLFEETELSNPGQVRKFLETLRRTRKTIQDAQNVLRGVQSDVFQALDAVNQAVLLAKDVVGVAGTIADFPSVIKSNIETLVSANEAQWRLALAPFNRPDIRDLPSTGDAAKQNVPRPSGNQDKGDPAGDANQRVTKAILDAISDPEVADGIELAALQPLPQSVQDQIDAVSEAALNTSATDIRNAADKLKELSENYANSTGMMDATYAATFGITQNQVSGRVPNEDDILLAAAIEEQRSALIESLATGTMYKEKPENLFLVANTIIAAEDAIPTPTSSYAVIVEKGLTLDRMALKYLGDTRAARDIAVLNSLRAPYIDEDGFEQPISGVSERSFVVANRDRLTLGQGVQVKADGKPGTKRKIVAIRPVGVGQFEVTVDGRANLSSYALAANTRIHARTPGTIGSGDILLIPSRQTAQVADSSRSTPLSERLTFAERIFKVDIALQDSGDLAIGTDGDMKRAYGYANAVQALRLLIETEQGELEQHPNFGIDASVGKQMVSDVIDEIGTRIRDSVLRDPRFNDALVDVVNTGTELNIRIEAKGRDNTGLVPVQFKVTV